MEAVLYAEVYLVCMLIVGLLHHWIYRKDEISAVDIGWASGQRITNKKRKTLDVTVRFSINSRDMATRSTILDTVNAWAWGGGTLTLNNRTNKNLTVELAQAPGGGDQYKWTSEYTIVFRAYVVPYWQDVSATTKTLTQGGTGSDSITMPGSAESVADVSIQNKSGDTLNEVTVSVNGYAMSFTNLNMANNGTLTIDHVMTNGVFALRAKIGTSSVLQYRTGADDFITKPGANAISYTAEGAVIVSVSAKGRYL